MPRLLGTAEVRGRGRQVGTPTCRSGLGSVAARSSTLALRTSRSSTAFKQYTELKSGVRCVWAGPGPGPGEHLDITQDTSEVSALRLPKDVKPKGLDRRGRCVRFGTWNVSTLFYVCAYILLVCCFSVFD